MNNDTFTILLFLLYPCLTFYGIYHYHVDGYFYNNAMLSPMHCTNVYSGEEGSYQMNFSGEGLILGCSVLYMYCIICA
jgi:hypothetical protein